MSKLNYFEESAILIGDEKTGKSYKVKNNISKNILDDEYAIVLDFGDDYQELAESFSACKLNGEDDIKLDFKNKSMIYINMKNVTDENMQSCMLKIFNQVDELSINVQKKLHLYIDKGEKCFFPYVDKLFAVEFLRDHLDERVKIMITTTKIREDVIGLRLLNAVHSVVFFGYKDISDNIIKKLELIEPVVDAVKKFKYGEYVILTEGHVYIRLRRQNKRT